MCFVNLASYKNERHFDSVSLEGFRFWYTLIFTGDDGVEPLINTTFLYSLIINNLRHSRNRASKSTMYRRFNIKGVHG